MPADMYTGADQRIGGLQAMTYLVPYRLHNQRSMG